MALRCGRCLCVSYAAVIASFFLFQIQLGICNCIKLRSSVEKRRWKQNRIHDFFFFFFVFSLITNYFIAQNKIACNDMKSTSKSSVNFFFFVFFFRTLEFGAHIKMSENRFFFCVFPHLFLCVCEEFQKYNYANNFLCDWLIVYENARTQWTFRAYVTTIWMFGVYVFGS